MDLAFTPEEQKFADEVRAFVKANLPADIRDKVKNGKHLGRDDYMRWQQALGKQGWLVYTWPKKHGGPGFTPAAALHLREHLRRGVCARHHPVRHQDGRAGDLHLRQRGAEGEVPAEPIRKSTVWWCQGYSEPGSGSDLASLRTKAEKQGDHYIVNGSKTWNTMGHWADWIFCLVRTDPKAKPQEGISFLLIDMKTPGITVKPIIMADGGHEVNEVFFDNVKVPVANLVGKENEGWTCAKFLLANERLGIAAVPQSKRGVEALKDIARAEQDERQAADREPELRREDRRSGNPGDGAGIHRAARAVADGAWRPARAGGVGPEDPRLGDPAAHHRAHHGSGRRIRRALPAGPAVAGHRTRSRSARPTPTSRHRATSTRARPRSTAAATRSRRASSARWCWGCDGR